MVIAEREKKRDYSLIFVWFIYCSIVIYKTEMKKRKSIRSSLPL